MSKIIAIIGISFILASCVHRPPALTTPHVPTVTTDQKPGAVTR
jgi:starvation-inducible outer membrane lipoprotein